MQEEQSITLIMTNIYQALAMSYTPLKHSLTESSQTPLTQVLHVAPEETEAKSS